jgi:hypothetical protein
VAAMAARCLPAGRRAQSPPPTGQVHGEGSGQVAVTLGVGEGQELLHFLVGLEGIRGKLIERADRPGILRGEQLRDRQARTGSRLARVTVCARPKFPPVIRALGRLPGLS